MNRLYTSAYDIIHIVAKVLFALAKGCDNMSNKEKIIQLLDKVPDYKLGYVMAYIQGITADSDTDDLYCESLLNEYLADTDSEKHDTMLLSDFAKEQGITL